MARSPDRMRLVAATGTRMIPPPSNLGVEARRPFQFDSIVGDNKLNTPVSQDNGRRHCGFPFVFAFDCDTVRYWRKHFYFISRHQNVLPLRYWALAIHASGLKVMVTSNAVS